VLRCCGVRLAVRGTGTSLARGGSTAQKPLRREYPAIVARARQARGVVV
jgi:hypothetical protein